MSTFSFDSPTPGTRTPGDLFQNLVVGNIPGAVTFELAETWLRNHCKEHDLDQPLEVFKKSEYRGVVFVKSASDEIKNKLMASLQIRAKQSYKRDATDNMFTNIDLPIDVRMAETCLFKMKRMLVGWGYKSGVEVDTDNDIKVLKVAKQDIIHATVQDYKLILKWTDGGWETWEALQTSEELNFIKTGVQDKFNKAKDLSTCKGKGKQIPE